jgi:hypothetical protein
MELALETSFYLRFLNGPKKFKRERDLNFGQDSPQSICALRDTQEMLSI